MAATKLTITIPDDLAERLEPWRDRMNISKVCARAIEAEMDNLSIDFTPEIANQLEVIGERICKDPEQERKIYDRAHGQADGEAYAVERLDYHDFVEYQKIWLTPRDKQNFELPKDVVERINQMVDSGEIVDEDEYRAGWLEGVNNIWATFKRRWLQNALRGLAERRQGDVP